MENPLYLYHFSYQDSEEALAKLIFSQLFDNQAFACFAISYQNYDLENWVFLHFKIEILAQATSFSTFKQELTHLDLQDWRLDTWHYNKALSYNQRIAITKELAATLANEGRIANYSLELTWVYLENIWYLGSISYNEYAYKLRIPKPYQYSSALPVRLCHQLANLLNSMMPQSRFVDPAAGSGTLVIEALIAGLNIKAYEINKILYHQANANLIHYGLPAIIQNLDMLKTTELFDVCVLDLPYGLFTAVGEKQQLQLLWHSLEIADYLLLISTDDYSDVLKSKGCQIIWQCHVSKGKFTRLITWIKK